MRTILAVLVILTLLLSGVSCAPSPAAPSPAVSPKPAAPTTVAPAPTTPTPPPAEQSKYGGILRTTAASPPAIYDLHLLPPFSPFYVRPVFSNLIRFDPLKREATINTIQGDLAERWEVSADGKVITFFLVKNAKWHNGQPFNADDIVYSLNKMADPKRSALATSLAVIEKVERVDDLTVRVSLKQPSPGLIIRLAGPYANIQWKGSADFNSRATDFLMGTGPFKFKAMVSGVSFDYVKNPDYFLKDAAGRPLPYLDGLNYTIVADQSAQIDSLVAGRLDMSAMNFGIPTQEVLERLKTQAPTMVIDSRVQYPGPVFCFNNDYGPLKDIRVRRALAMLVDQKQLVMAGYGGDNWGGYSAFFLPPPYSLTAAEGGKLLGWDKPWDTRVAEAKKLLAEAGYAAGFKLKLQVGSTPQMQREVAVLADTYRRNLGLDTEIEAVRDPTEWRKMREQKNFQMTFDAIGGSEPDDYITFLMTGGSSNFMKYSNPKVDALLLQQSTTMDLGKRVQATQEMARLLLEDMVFVPAHGGTLYVAWQPYVKGYVNQELSYGTPILLERVWLSK